MHYFDSLLELDLSNTSVSSHTVASELPSLTQLIVLGLQGLRLVDDDMAVISSLRQLRKLNISETGWVTLNIHVHVLIPE